MILGVEIAGLVGIAGVIIKIQKKPDALLPAKKRGTKYKKRPKNSLPLYEKR